MTFKQNDHPNCYTLLNYTAYKRIINFQINTISIFLLIQFYLTLSNENIEQRYTHFCTVNKCEYRSKPLNNVYKVSVQITSLEQILILCAIGKCRCRVREQLITIYTNGSPSIKILKLVTYAQLFAVMFGKWFKGYLGQKQSCRFLSSCPRENRDSQFFLILDMAEAQFLTT